MCGIVGMISRQQSGFYHNDLELMENLLVLDTLRGLDSTGVFGVDNNKNVGVMKIASHPYHLFACEDWKKFRQKSISSGRIIIGHNRKATQGAVNSNNAHPFHENNIVLVHNGTLRGDHRKKFADVAVDSHAVCHAFNEKGAEAVIPTIDGAFAFVWWDIEKGKLFAIRNDERPLNIVLTSDLLILCSEAWMAEILLRRGSKKVEQVIPLEEGLLYEFNLRGEYTTKKLELYKAPIVTASISRYDSANDWGNYPKKDTGTGALTVIKNNHAPTVPGIDTSIASKFPTGSKVRLQIQGFDTNDRQTHVRAFGKVADPAYPNCDFICNIPCVNKVDVVESRVTKFMEKGYVIGTINSYHVSTCGPSVYVRDLVPEERVTIHNGDVSELTWQRVVSHHQCKDCNAAIFDEEAPFTAVYQSSPDVVTGVVCADCVEDKLPIGELKNEFSQRRADALQVQQPVSNQPSGSSVSTTGDANSPTLH